MQKDLLDQVPPHDREQKLSPANEAFERFWEVKPEREGPNPKGDAKSAFLKLVSRKIDPEAIIAAASDWQEEERKAGNLGNRFVKTAVAWLNQYGREAAFEAKEPPTKKTKSHEEAVAKAAQLGWIWNGDKWVRDPDAPAQQPRRFTPARVFTVEDRATLFVPRETPFYESMRERHEDSDKKSSYYGKSFDQTKDGIWVSPEWFVPGRARERLQLHQLNVAAPEVIAEDSTPYASALPLDAYADALSVPDEEVDFGA